MSALSKEAELDTPAGFSLRLESLIGQRRPDKDNALLKQFAARFWRRAPAEELEDIELTNAYGSTLMAYHLLSEGTDGSNFPDPLKIQIVNPDKERDGWQSPHTVVLLIHTDMPFLVDSILLELSHSDMTTHTLKNVVLSTVRDKGELTGIQGEGEGEAETLIYAEIDRINVDEFADLNSRLRVVLTEVRQVVADFHPMKDKVREIIDQLDNKTGVISQPQLDEAKHFLAWLLNNHFTFLGYRQFKIHDGLVEQEEGSALGLLKLRSNASTRNLAEMPERTRSFILEPELLSFSKSGTRSRVHRHAYPDYIAVKLFNEAGDVVGECGFLGLYTSVVYTDHPESIPFVAPKVQRILDRSQLDPTGFNGKVLAQVLAIHPRDELFQSKEDELYDTAMAITFSHERSRVKLFIREGRYGLFYSCLVYVPREIYNTKLRLGIQELLIKAFDAIDSEFYSHMSESILVRTQIILRVHPLNPISYNVQDLEAQIIELARDWTHDLQQLLKNDYSEEVGRRYSRSYLHSFPSSYKETFPVRAAFYDVKHLDKLNEKKNLVTRFYRNPQDDAKTVRLKIFHLGDFLPLSDIIPMLENLGMRVIGEQPFRIDNHDNQLRTIQDYELHCTEKLDLNRVGQVFEDAFIHIWQGDAENDSFNRLVLATEKSWREVSLLRTYAHYLKQLRTEFSEQFIADTLLKHIGVSRLLMNYFILKFSPDRQERNLDTAAATIRGLLDNVSLLNEDRILRRYLEMMENTLRTNYFQVDANARPKTCISLKLDTGKLAGVPEPRPAFEIFLYSPRFEGVHLRNGEFARGGLRWSDRQEDFRTEVLALAKAQTIKNALIVPTGAKGGFVLKRQTNTQEALTEEGIYCYKQFISGLLDITDNLQQGKVIPPENVVRYDGDDPYLVVAADKGTATFSDTANQIAESVKFWLGDAFASGGSNGYDHKAMAITAKGAWISVQRHFRELGMNIQTEPLTIIGIGDMSGDVFGNGMLQSQSVRLVAAFNHMHIFIDPDPDPKLSHAERARLFKLGPSTWSDYDESLISAGGGIYSRLQKSITVSREMKALFDISDSSLSPDELIHQLLKAPVDLIWNGGIGTYVKASDESDEEVADRSNDSLRVVAADLRCLVIGEGGNLGLTQKARVEYALMGGHLNTDFIDNSAGVDCSDHEVNIKILLNQQVEDGELTTKQRNKLLAKMTEEVSDLVLDNNYRQALALSLAQRHSESRMAEYIRLINTLVVEQQLNRYLENIPADEELLERTQQGKNLTRPELAVLLSYAKLDIKRQLLASPLDTYTNLRGAVLLEFPASLRKKYSEHMYQHPLHKEIIATQIANDVVHHMGLSFVTHLKEYVGRSCIDIVQAYAVMIECFRIREYWRLLERATEMNENDRLELHLNLMRLGRRATRWFLRHHRSMDNAEGLIENVRPCIDALRAQQRKVLGEDAWQGWQLEVNRYVEAGCPRDIAKICVGAPNSVAALHIIEASEESGIDVIRAAEVYAQMGNVLKFEWISENLNKVETQSHWQAMERDALLDEFMTRRGSLTADALNNINDEISTTEGVENWLNEHRDFVENWHQVIEDTQRSGVQDFALYSLTSRKLGDLVHLF